MTKRERQAAHDFRNSITERGWLLFFLFQAALESIKTVQDTTDYNEDEATKTHRVSQAQWLAQDSGNALMLILDYAMFRFLKSSGAIKRKRRNQKPPRSYYYSRADLHNELQRRGPEAYGGVRLGEAIATLADLARHLHEFQGGAKPFEANRKVLHALGLGKKHDQAAAQFLQNLEIEYQKNNGGLSYNHFERGLAQIAG